MFLTFQNLPARHWIMQNQDLKAILLPFRLVAITAQYTVYTQSKLHICVKNRKYSIFSNAPNTQPISQRI